MAQTMSPYHRRQAAMILGRANKRTRRKGSNEARAERAKVREMPQLDPTRREADRRPAHVYSPQSSWRSIANGIGTREWMGDGYKVEGKGKAKRPKGALKSL